jgi:hypothetical protein
MVYSSTSIRLFIDNCPFALELYKQGAYQDKTIFQAGIAAHAVLEHAGREGARNAKTREAHADAVISALIERGHTYFGQQEPPMHPEEAFKGRELALIWMSQHEFPEKANYERAFYINRQGKACDETDSGARFRALIDCTYEDFEGEEEYQEKVVAVMDYKSSWHDREEALETFQRKSQAVCVYQSVKDDHSIKGLRMEIANLRTGGIYSRVIWFDEETEEMLEQWTKDILQICDAADVSKAARPGVGCITCPYVQECRQRAEIAVKTHSDKAAEYCRTKAYLAELTKELKLAAQEEPISVPDGKVGFFQKSQAVVSIASHLEILRAWLVAVDHEHADIDIQQMPLSFAPELSLIRSMDLGVTQVKAAAKAFFPDKSEQKDFIERCLTSKLSCTFKEMKK